MNNRLYIGWQEWCALPDLGIPAVKAKIDTGAKTSALHAFDIHPLEIDKHPHVKFKLHPLQNNTRIVHQCQALIIDERLVKSSNGQIEQRYVIATTIKLGSQQWNIEVTLSNRDPLKFRMLLGREALHTKILIDPNHKLCQGKISRLTLKKFYS